KGNSVPVIQRRDFRLKLQPDVLFVEYRRLEIEADAILFEQDSHRVVSGARAVLNDRDRNLAPGEEARLLPVHGDQIRLRQRAQSALRLERAQERKHVIAAHNEEVERRGDCAKYTSLINLVNCVGALAGVEICALAWFGLNRRRKSQLLQSIAAHFGDANLQLHLRHGQDGLHEQVDRLEAGGLYNGLDLLRDLRIHIPRDHDRAIGLAEPDIFFREERPHLRVNLRQVGPHIYIQKDELTVIFRPHSKTGAAGRLAVDRSEEHTSELQSL